MLFGQSSDKGNILVRRAVRQAGSRLGRQPQIFGDAQYIYNTQVNTHAGSSRTPGGRFFLPAGSPIANQLGCTSVTLSGNKLPSLTTPPTAADFRCYNSANDGFNFQAVGNYDLMPNERTGVFALGNYKLTDNVEAYGELLYHKMVAHSSSRRFRSICQQQRHHSGRSVSTTRLASSSAPTGPHADDRAAPEFASAIAARISPTPRARQRRPEGHLRRLELELGPAFQLRPSELGKAVPRLPQLQPARAGTRAAPRPTRAPATARRSTSSTTTIRTRSRC